MEIGRICIKLAGRDARKKCVVIDILDERFVMIDGETRRRKCNVSHLEPLTETIKIEKNAEHKTVVAEFKKLGIEIKDSKPKIAKDRPRQQRKVSEKEEKPKKVEKKPVKKTKKVAKKE